MLGQARICSPRSQSSPPLHDGEVGEDLREVDLPLVRVVGAVGLAVVAGHQEGEFLQKVVHAAEQFEQLAERLVHPFERRQGVLGALLVALEVVVGEVGQRVGRRAVAAEQVQQKGGGGFVVEAVAARRTAGAVQFRPAVDPAGAAEVRQRHHRRPGQFLRHLDAGGRLELDRRGDRVFVRPAEPHAVQRRGRVAGLLQPLEHRLRLEAVEVQPDLEVVDEPARPLREDRPDVVPEVGDLVFFRIEPVGPGDVGAVGVLPGRQGAGGRGGDRGEDGGAIPADAAALDHRGDVRQLPVRDRRPHDPRGERVDNDLDDRLGRAGTGFGSRGRNGFGHRRFCGTVGTERGP